MGAKESLVDGGGPRVVVEAGLWAAGAEKWKIGRETSGLWWMMFASGLAMLLAGRQSMVLNGVYSRCHISHPAAMLKWSQLQGGNHWDSFIASCIDRIAAFGEWDDVGREVRFIPCCT